MCNHDTQARLVAHGGNDDEGNHVYICGSCGCLVVAYWSPSLPQPYGHVFNVDDLEKIIMLMRSFTYNYVNSGGIEA